MLDGAETLLHRATWVILAILGIGALLYGFGSNMADRVWGPDPAEVRAQCIRTAKRERERCRKGIFKTTRRIEMCQQIYDEAVGACGEAVGATQ